MSFVKSCCVLLIFTFLTITLSSSPSLATNWYWASGFDGWWDDANEYYNPWQDSSGNSPTTADGAPGVGDSAYLVIPYMGSFCDGTGYCYIQPVGVYYQSTESPPLNNIAIEGGNVLYQWYGLGSDPADLNLTSNAEYIGGTPFSYDDLPPFTYIDPSVGIYPRGEHIQNAGTNIVNDRLEIGGTEGSYGRYYLDNASDSIYGTLSAESLEIIGSAGEGLFEQRGGVHEVGTALIMGMSATGSGTYQMTDGTLDAKTAEIIGSSGYGEFTQSGGEHTASQLRIGLHASGEGIYNLDGGKLVVTGTNIIGNEGKGSFIQNDGTHDVENLTLGAEDSSFTANYELIRGTLTVGKTEIIGSNGDANFTQTGGAHNTPNLTLGEQSGSNGSYTISGLDTTLHVFDKLSVGNYGNGTFVQDNGTVTIGTLAPGEFWVGYGSGIGNYTLNDGWLTVKGSSVVRKDSTFTQTNGEYLGISLLAKPGSTYLMEGGKLDLNEWNADGNITQTGGEAIISSSFKVGGVSYLPNVTSSYLLDATGKEPWDVNKPSITVNGLGEVGIANDGKYTQRGAESYAQFDGLTLGAGHKGDYILEEGLLSVRGQTTVGSTTRGVFTQQAGEHHVYADLVVGEETVGTYYQVGTYEHNNGFLRVEGDTILGQLGSGIFNQKGGSHITGNLLLGVTSRVEPDGSVLTGTGAYYLHPGGTLNVSGEEIIGGTEEESRFTQTGGSHEVTGDLSIGGNSRFSHYAGTVDVDSNLYLGRGDFDSTAKYTLRGDAELTVAGDVWIGPFGPDIPGPGWPEPWPLPAYDLGPGEFTQLGGKHTVLGDVYLRGLYFSGTGYVQGIYDQSDGELVIHGALDSHSGHYIMSGGRLETTTHSLDGIGLFEQTGGEHVVNNLMTVGGSAHAIMGSIGNLTAGGITVNEGSFTMQGDSTASIAESITLNHNDGSFTLQGNSSATADSISISRGSFILEGRNTITAPGGITNLATFTVTGAGLKTIDADFYNQLDGETNVSNTLAEYLGHVDNECGGVSDCALFSITNSGVDFYGGVLNKSYMTIDPGIPPEVIIRRAKFLIEDSLVYFHENVTNRGRMQITNSVIHGTIYESGDYSELIIDPSDVYFSTMTFSDNATIQAGLGDRIFIEGDFVNGSLENTLWDTSDASLIFNGSGTQNFYLAGIDLGATAAGYENNFAWGELILGSGVNLNLLDGNDVPGAALYIGLLGFEDPVVDLYDLIFGSFMSDFNVYYNSSLGGNSFLGGMSYALGGSGYLLPAFLDTPPTEPIPEPSTFVLLGCGLVGLFFIVRRRREERSS